MQFFQFVIIVVAIVVGGGVVRRLVSSTVASRKSDQEAKKFELTTKRLEKSLDERIGKIEDLLANLETIVIEEEKTRKFDAL